MTIGERIKTIRENKGMTQETLAQLSNTTKQSIYKYEKNIVTNIPLDRLELIAKSLNVEQEFLMGWDKSKKQPTNESGELSDGEKMLINLFRQVPEEKQEMVVKMIEAALKSQGLL